MDPILQPIFEPCGAHTASSALRKFLRHFGRFGAWNGVVTDDSLLPPCMWGDGIAPETPILWAAAASELTANAFCPDSIATVRAGLHELLIASVKVCQMCPDAILMVINRRVWSISEVNELLLNLDMHVRLMRFEHGLTMVTARGKMDDDTTTALITVTGKPFLPDDPMQVIIDFDALLHNSDASVRALIFTAGALKPGRDPRDGLVACVCSMIGSGVWVQSQSVYVAVAAFVAAAPPMDMYELLMRTATTLGYGIVWTTLLYIVIVDCSEDKSRMMDAYTELQRYMASVHKSVQTIIQEKGSEGVELRADFNELVDKSALETIMLIPGIKSSEPVHTLSDLHDLLVPQVKRTLQTWLDMA